MALPVREGAPSTPDPAAEGTVKPKPKKPPAAPSGLTSPVSPAASGSAGSGGVPQPTTPGTAPAPIPADTALGLQPVTDDLGMYGGALTTVPGFDPVTMMDAYLGVDNQPTTPFVSIPQAYLANYTPPSVHQLQPVATPPPVAGLPVPYAAGGNSTGSYGTGRPWTDEITAAVTNAIARALTNPRPPLPPGSPVPGLPVPYAAGGNSMGNYAPPPAAAPATPAPPPTVHRQEAVAPPPASAPVAGLPVPYAAGGNSMGNYGTGRPWTDEITSAVTNAIARALTDPQPPQAPVQALPPGSPTPGLPVPYAAGGGNPNPTAPYHPMTLDEQAAGQAQRQWSAAHKSAEEEREHREAVIASGVLPHLTSMPQRMTMTGYMPYNIDNAVLDSVREGLAHTATSRDEREAVLEDRGVHGRVNLRRNREGPEGPTRGGGQANPLTTEEYNALDEDERAAVDFNTSLLQVTKRDKVMQDLYQHNEDSDAKYDALVQKMFGNDGFGDIYAPETVAFLNQIGFKDKDADLDDFLDLKVAISNNDLKHLDFNAPILDPLTPDGTPQQELHKLQSTLALNTEAAAQEMAEGDRILQNVSSMLRAERNESDSISNLGGIEKSVGYGLGFGTGEEDKRFQGFFNELVQAKGDAKKVWDLRMSKVPDDWKGRVTDYIQRRSLSMDRFNLSFGEEGDGFLSPEEFRNALGLNGPTNALAALPESQRGPEGKRNKAASRRAQAEAQYGG